MSNISTVVNSLRLTFGDDCKFESKIADRIQSTKQRIADIQYQQTSLNELEARQLASLDESVFNDIINSGVPSSSSYYAAQVDQIKSNIKAQYESLDQELSRLTATCNTLCDAACEINPDSQFKSARLV